MKAVGAVDLSWAATARRSLERSLGPGWFERTDRDIQPVDLQNSRLRLTVLAGITTEHDGDWIHASICHHERMPDYAELKALHRAVFGDRVAYQWFGPDGQHINIRETVLHLWGKADGSNPLPDFGREGTI